MSGSAAKRLLGSLAAGYTLFLLLAAMEYMTDTLNDSTLAWITLLSTIYSFVSLAFSKRWYDGIVFALIGSAFLLFICALILAPLSPLLLIGSIERIIAEGPSVKNVLILLFSITSFVILVAIVTAVVKRLLKRAKNAQNRVQNRPVEAVRGVVCGGSALTPGACDQLARLYTTTRQMQA
jgi:membrane protein implicated in regulation of membrane protease activity